MITKIDYREILTEKVCPDCLYYGDCISDADCEALRRLVRICENMGLDNPDY